MKTWEPKDNARKTCERFVETIARGVHPAERPGVLRDVAKDLEKLAVDAEKSNERDGVPE